MVDDWEIDNGIFTATGRAYRRIPAHNLSRFFVNGVPVDTVDYPLTEPDPSGAMALLVGTEKAIFKLCFSLESNGMASYPFLRVDFAPDGVYREHADASAWFFCNPTSETAYPNDASRQRVIGDDFLPRFLMGGASMYKRTEGYLRRVLGKTWSDLGPVLDWGCGAGRLSRYLVMFSDTPVWGADIDAQNVDWCHQNLSGERFLHLPLSPPTELPSDHFGLVFGVSVFTHLTIDQQDLWMREIHRILRTGGFFFVSVSGPVYFAYSRFPSALIEKIDRLGFCDEGVDPTLLGYIEDDEYYRSSFMTRNFMVEKWSGYFEIVDIIDGMAANHDFVVLRKPA